MKADWVTIHHEGAGSPTDNVARFLNTDDYSAGIGVSLYELRRSPEDSFITTNQPGHCLQICLSGNRSVHALTDADLGLIAQCCDDARARGWLVDNPDVLHHGDNGKSECPGANTNARRSDVHEACQGIYQSRGDVPEGDDDVPTGAQQMAVTPSGGGYYVVGSDGGVFCYGDAGFYGSCGDKVLNAPVVGITVTPSGRGYWLLAQDGGVFSFGDAQFLGAPTGDVR